MIRYEISTEHNKYENMTVYNRMNGDTPNGWRVNADNGFVMYDPTEEVSITIDPVTGEEISSEVYYSCIRYLPRNYDWNKFTLIAVPE